MMNAPFQSNLFMLKKASALLKLNLSLVFSHTPDFCGKLSNGHVQPAREQQSEKLLEVRFGGSDACVGSSPRRLKDSFPTSYFHIPSPAISRMIIFGLKQTSFSIEVIYGQ
jgi:hypothetical protein